MKEAARSRVARSTCAIVGRTAASPLIVLVDKHLDALTRLADRHVVIEKGHVVWTGTSAALARDPSVKQRYLQV